LQREFPVQAALAVLLAHTHRSVGVFLSAVLVSGV